MDGKAVIITHGYLLTPKAKTAHGLIRDSSRYDVIAVIDPVAAGQDAGEVLDGKHRNIPVYATLQEFKASSSEEAPYCLIGVAGKGGMIPDGMLNVVEEAISLKMHIINGLHEFMSDIPHIKALADMHGVSITDIRKPKPGKELNFWWGRIKKVRSLKLAVLGTDCNLGKRTTARLLLYALRKADISAELIYTGQTGWMQGSSFGFIFDTTPNDFISGEIEDAMVSCYEAVKPQVMMLEGQSSLRNPSGPGGSEFLVSGEARHVVLQHAPARKYYYGYEDKQLGIPSLKSEVELIRMYGAEVVAITLNTKGLSTEEALHYKEAYQESLKIPVVLPLEEGCDTLVSIVRELVVQQVN